MGYAMGVVDWDKWMKARHIKLYTQEEWDLRMRRQRDVQRKYAAAELADIYYKSKGERK